MFVSYYLIQSLSLHREIEKAAFHFGTKYGLFTIFCLCFKEYTVWWWLFWGLIVFKDLLVSWLAKIDKLYRHRLVENTLFFSSDKAAKWTYHSFRMEFAFKSVQIRNIWKKKYANKSQFLTFWVMVCWYVYIAKTSNKCRLTTEIWFIFWI